MAGNAWFFTIILLIGLSFIFISVFNNSKNLEEYDEIQNRSYKIRGYWVKFLFIFGLGLSFYTLTPFPIEKIDSKVSEQREIVKIVGKQWYWEVEKTELKTNVTYEFHVTSGDVNHGFSLYDENTKLLTQTQAMPGYSNKVVYKFTKPGVYRVLCLEYCGLAHHSMVIEFHVSDSKEKANG